VGKVAHTTGVVTVPGLGDEIQAVKAGILEIGDLFVVNKADREGADKWARELEVMRSLVPPKEGWHPKVYRTVATTGEGVEELLQGILEHGHSLEAAHPREEKDRARSRWILLELLKDRLMGRILEEASKNGTLDDLIERIAKRELDPHSAVDQLLNTIGL